MNRLDFEPIGHHYALNGVPVPSVTGILRASGIVDFSRIPASDLEAARYRGSIVHQAVHYYNEDDINLDAFRAEFPGFVGYLEGWFRFREQRRFRPVLNEHRVASIRHGVAGTLDTLGIIDDDHAALLDYATGRPEDVAKNLQTAAYLGLAHEWAEEGPDPQLQKFLTDYPTIKRYAVALRRDGTFKLEPYKDPADFRKFLTLNEAQRIVAAHRGEWAALANVAA